MTAYLVFLIAVTLLTLNGSAPLANTHPSVRTLVSRGGQISQSTEFAPMRLIFGTPSNTGAHSFITEVGTDGLTPLLDMPYGFTDGDFSFDGGSIAFDNCGDRYAKPRGIYVVNLAAHTARRVLPLTNKICMSVRWAPDGQRLSFLSQDDHRLHIVNLNTNEVTVMPNIGVLPFHWWSPKGDEIVFERGRGGRRELFITDLDGHERQLSYLKDFNNRETWAPTWSRDGNSIAFTVETRSKRDLYTIAPDGNAIKRLETPDNVYSPRWSADSEWIIYEDGNQLMEKTPRLIRIRKDGTDRTLIGELPTQGRPFSIGPKV